MTQGRKKTGGAMLAQAASEYNETHYKEKFSLRKMADSLYVNESYLLRQFFAGMESIALFYKYF